MADTTSSLDPGILLRNLDALNESFPALAVRVQAARDLLPQTTPALTRDGRCSLRLVDDDGQEKWLGRTSIPAVRAAALVDRFEAGLANVLLPGIAEGSEAELLLARFGRHRAVFVWQENPASLLLAFSLHDFADAIRTKRLVPFVAPIGELSETLVALLEDLPGHTCPDRLLIWPWQTPVSIGPCRTAIEAACNKVETQRRGQLADLQRRLAGLDCGGSVAGIALLSIHAQPEVLACVDAIAGALADAGYRPALACLRTPGDVHPLARARSLAASLEHRPELAVLFDVCRAEVADVLPESLPAISWLSHNAAVDDGIGKRLGPRDRLAVTDSVLAGRVVRFGIERSRLAIVPQPAMLTAESVPGWQERTIDVAMVALLSPTDPRNYGFDLPTHLTVWNAAVDLLRKDLDSFTDLSMSKILERAERQTRVAIGDAAVRTRMLETLGGPVASSLILEELRQALNRCGLAVSCYGHGWAQPVASASVPGPTDRFEIYRRAKVALFVSTTGVVPADVLLAASAGTVVAWRTHPRDKQPGGFASLLDPRTQAVCFDRNQTVASPIARLLGSPEQWHSVVTAARERCQTDHSPAAALARLRTAASS